MKLKKLTIFEFEEFANKHLLGSYHQTYNYAMNMSENGYDYDLIGMIDNNNKIVAASLILFKKISFFNKYGYAPKGFLIDYYDTNLLRKFVELIKKYYYKQNFSFIKINPEIAIGQMDFKKNTIIYNENKKLINTLEELGFKQLKINKLFEAKLPKYNAILVLKNSTLSSFDKRTRNKVRKSINKGLSLVKGQREDIETIYKFFEKKKNYPISHYYNYYNAFSKNDLIDVFVVKINFEQCLLNCQKSYQKELDRNNELVENLMNSQTENNLKKKMESDNALECIKNDMAFTTKCLTKNKEGIIAGAITIKYKNRVSILISGYDQKYKRFNPNYFLHYSLIEYYKDKYDFLDLNGITGDFSKDNPYKGLNEFKLGFKPYTYEYIGEFDLIINEGLYKNLESSGQLAKEFPRRGKSLPTEKE